jgi:hypothetical protein
MRIHFVTFATPAFRGRQLLLHYSARRFGAVDESHVWTQARLSEDGFTARHPELFPDSTGFGWYAWKPYIIWQTLLHAAEGDLVIYQDVGRREPVLISRSLREWDRFLAEQNISCIAGVSIPCWGANQFWTKRETFDRMGLLDQYYKDSPQVQASWSVWRKCSAMESFVREWANQCQQLDLVGGRLPDGLEGEVAGFKEHRWDQSILTLLALRDKMPILTTQEMRHPELNEKSIDSFTKQANASSCFAFFRQIVRGYHLLESKLKSLSSVTK